MSDSSSSMDSPTSSRPYDDVHAVYDFMDDSIVQERDLNYHTISQGTLNFVDVLFQNHNMFTLMKKMVEETGKSSSIGVLPCYSMDEIDIRENSYAMELLQKNYASFIDRSKKIYITNFAIGKSNGHNHYCAFWLDMREQTIEIWDSATSKYEDSEFTQLFSKCAYFFFVMNPHLQAKNLAAKKVFLIRGTTDETFFQYQGGYTDVHLARQNIFCHTWTLFFLELRLNDISLKKIACLRGSNPLIPFVLIKLYAQCLLVRMGQDIDDPRFEGLRYLYDDDLGKVIILPELSTRHNDSCCTQQIVSILLKSKLYTKPDSCTRDDVGEYRLSSSSSQTSCPYVVKV